MIGITHLGGALKQEVGEKEEIAEVKGIARLQGILVERVELRRFFLIGVKILRLVFLRADTAVLGLKIPLDFFISFA